MESPEAAGLGEALPFLPHCPAVAGSGSVVVGTTQCSRSQAEMKWASVGHGKRGPESPEPELCWKTCHSFVGGPDCLFTGQKAHLEMLGRKGRASPCCQEPGHLGESPHTHEGCHNPQSSEVPPLRGQSILQFSQAPPLPQVEVRCRPHGVLDRTRHVAAS